MKRFYSKKEAFDFFEEQIARAYHKLYKDKKLEYESYLLKSYLLEINISDLEEKRDKIIKTLFSISLKDKMIDVEVNEIESDFFELVYKSLNISIYVEWISQRFLFLYTLSKTQKVDNLLHKIVFNQPRIDQFWLWDEFLNSQITKYNRFFKGFSFDYDYRPIIGREDEEVLSYLKMQLWGGGKELNEIYNKLRKILSQMAILGKVRFKEFGDNENEFIISDIKFTGKVKSYGTSIGIHRKILVDLKQQYERKLHQIDKYRLKWSSENLLEGEPLYFVFSEPLSEKTLPELINKMFNGSIPFRLIGIVSQTGKYKYIAHVVDLHIGEKFILQVFPDMIIAYLSEEVCSNTLLRLYTNLQHTLKTEVKLENDSEEKII
jgi:hypothetical protein